MAKQTIKVSKDQVRAARVEVEALRAAGREPDPMVVRLANARPLRSTGTIGGRQPRPQHPVTTS